MKVACETTLQSPAICDFCSGGGSRAIAVVVLAIWVALDVHRHRSEARILAKLALVFDSVVIGGTTGTFERIFRRHRVSVGGCAREEVAHFLNRGGFKFCLE